MISLRRSLKVYFCTHRPESIVWDEPKELEGLKLIPLGGKCGDCGKSIKRTIIVNWRDTF